MNTDHISVYRPTAAEKTTSFKDAWTGMTAFLHSAIQTWLMRKTQWITAATKSGLAEAMEDISYTY